jgi:exonuclease 3'-5' domain-containing protein 1
MEAFLSLITPSSSVYLDLEGKNLSREGTLTLLTVLLHPSNTVYIIDVLTLGPSAFTVGTPTLKSVLEDATIPKYIWDCRNDADALKAHFNVGLGGVLDIQLLENATRWRPKTYLGGLGKAVEYDLRPYVARSVLEGWVKDKKDGSDAMETDQFSARPMRPETVRYCVGDVEMLPRLREVYMRKITPDWLVKVKAESVRRVEEAHSAGYKPHGADKRIGPWRSVGGGMSST